ncbi:MAG: hypothetical protein L6R40_005870 [Gallowayella cf. fulva]|nr:MAG: hypothetical protein L6R40_005870 [Xanthomendoza cf. fulva]
MDQAAKGAAAIQAKDFSAAVTHYTKAIAINSQAVDYYIKRSTAYTRISPSDCTAALGDAEIALTLASKRGKRELIIQAQLRRAIAFFSLGRYGDAKACFDWVKEMNKDEKSLQIWGMKVENKLKGLAEDDDKAKATIQKYPEIAVPVQKEQPKATPVKPSEPAKDSASGLEAATKVEGVQTPANKIRHEWYQTDDTVVVSLFAKGVPKNKTTIDIQDNALAISFPLPTGSDYDFSLDPLCGKVDLAASTAKILSTKVEFILRKATVGEKWPSLESDVPPASESIEENTDGSSEEVKRAILADRPANAGPSYPTSAKSGPKNWDKLANDLTKKPKKDEKDGDDGGDDGLDEDFEGADPVNGFFQQLYSRADPDTRRAMMKSYQESNGTALSTNWSEVGKGKVETQPPDGMEAKPW